MTVSELIRILETYHGDTRVLNGRMSESEQDDIVAVTATMVRRRKAPPYEGQYVKVWTPADDQYGDSFAAVVIE